jgi:uncharacterized protein (TIGR02145 family)
MHNLQFNDQLWTTDNLDVSTYRNGDIIPHIEDSAEWANLKTGAWCYFENNIDNNLKFGKLYNYYAILDPRGLAPEGYRIPQHYDWLLLQPFGSRLKSRNDWNEKEQLDYYIPFNAKPGGYRDYSGNFRYKNEAMGWWASPENDVINQGNIAHWLYKDDQQLGWKPFFENYGFYVRCIEEKYKTQEFHFNFKFQLNYKSISLKYKTSTTFQEILNLLYNQFLKEKVKPHTYGKDWIIQIYNGEEITSLYKPENLNGQTFDSILKSNLLSAFRPYRLIISQL